MASQRPGRRAPAATHRLDILMVSEWLPGPDHPFRGIFVVDHARAVARYARVVLVGLPHGQRVAPNARAASAADLRSAGASLAGSERDPLAAPITSAARAGRVARALRETSLVRIDLDDRPAFRPRSVWTPLRLGRLVRRLAALGFRPAIVHAHLYTGALQAAPVARRLGVPLVVSEHASSVALDTLSTAQRTIARIGYRQADRICPVGEELAAAVAGLAGRTPVAVVPNPLDDETFSPRAVEGDEREASADGPEPCGGGRDSSPDGRLRLLSVGGLVPVKGGDVLVRAFARLLRDGVAGELTLVGSGPLEHELRTLAHDLGVAGSVRFAGALKRADVARELVRSDLFVAPSRFETFGVAACEALLAGVPVVGSAVGGLRRLLADSGMPAVPPDDPDALAVALRDACVRRDELRRRALSFAPRLRERYGLAAVGARWLAVYGELTTSAQPQR